MPASDCFSAAFAESLPAQASSGRERIPTLANLAKACDQLVSLLQCRVLLATESLDSPRNVVQSLEGVGARAPFSLQLQRRVGGVPLCGLPIAVFSVPYSGGVVCLALPRVGRFAPTGVARFPSIRHATGFTRDPCHSLDCPRGPLKVPTCITLLSLFFFGPFVSLALASPAPLGFLSCTIPGHWLIRLFRIRIPFEPSARILLSRWAGCPNVCPQRSSRRLNRPVGYRDCQKRASGPPTFIATVVIC